ncbi:uncharacterized protein LOC122195035 [Lactuca sativa]|uniref:uncharacterized protein LOC122195035 n=1 Tax=Lactuca sativa TaxID=4236 RepID=UPI001C68BFA1|nr:uncharacterized protein LOC122195035 [Lactuca sativa]
MRLGINYLKLANLWCSTHTQAVSSTEIVYISQSEHFVGVIMVNTRSMTRNQNYHASSRKRIRGRVPSPWSDLNHDLLYLIMMRLGVVEFLLFSRVCKSWRSLALFNRSTFMASKPPMLLFISPRVYKKDCYLQDFEGRKFKTIIPKLVGRKCVGLTCGYLILFGKKTRDFWLVNPITTHELHFPNAPLHVSDGEKRKFRAILVFSPSINRWVFAMLHKWYYKVWFSIAGKGEWNHVSSTSPLVDLHVFKGRIYTLNWSFTSEGKHVSEMRLDPVPTLVPKLYFLHQLIAFDFITSDENLYLMEYMSMHTYKVHKLDFDEMNCVPCEKSTQEYAFFNSSLKFSAAVISEAWAASSSSYCQQRFARTDKHGKYKGRLYIAKRWYFPHECLNINLIDN